MDKNAKRYHENMSKIFNAPNTNAQKNIDRYEENLKKAAEAEKIEPEKEILDEE